MKRRSNKAECVVAAIVLGAGSTAAADEPADAPVEELALDAAFLEYLGSWDDTDEDWMLFADDDEDSAVADGDERTPDDDESAERNDET